MTGVLAGLVAVSATALLSALMAITRRGGGIRRHIMAAGLAAAAVAAVLLPSSSDAQTPEELQALINRMKEAFQARNYAQALAGAEQFAALVEKLETVKAGKPGQARGAAGKEK